MRALLLLALGGCLFAARPPVPIRYFSPEVEVAASVDAPAARAALRLGRVTAAQHVRSRIAYRASPVEHGLYETLRWTEDPEAYVRRALQRSLFEDRGLVEALDSDVPILDIEVVAFEEVGRGERRLGRVQLRYELYDDRRMIARGLVTEERPSTGPEIDRVVIAIGGAMHAASARVAREISDALGPRT